MRPTTRAILVLAILVTVGILLIAVFANQNGEETTREPVSSPTEVALPETMEPIATPNEREIPKEDPQLPQSVDADWQTIARDRFSFRYPEELSVEQRAGSVTLSYLGPTQRLGTELYDGISLRFERGSYTQDSLRAFVDSLREDMETSPGVESVSGVQTVQLAGENGYRFTVVSLGERTYTYLPIDDGQYLVLIDGTVDPANYGYGQTVQAILSTLEIE